MNVRVLVIGAGMAGLTAARRLAGAGLNVLVLEKNDYPGGRVRSDNFNGISWNCGAQFVGGMYPLTSAILKDMGLNRSLAPVKMRVDVMSDSTVYPLCRHTLAWAYPLFNKLPWPKRLSPLKLGYHVWSHRHQLDITDLTKGVELDDCSFGDWARTRLCPELAGQYLDPVVRALFFQPADDISRLIPLTLIRSPHRCRIYSLQGGLGLLPEMMAQRVPVVTGARALGVSLNTARRMVEVETTLPGGKKETLSVHRVVFATPPTEVLSILHDPQATVGRSAFDFISSTAFVDVAVTCLVLSAPIVRGLYGYVFQSGCSGLTSISFGRDNEGRPGPKDTAVIISSGTAQDLVKLAESHLPGLSDKIVERRDYHWEHAIPCFPPGRIRQVKNFLETPPPSKLFAFCGDYIGGPGIEGASASGLWAAEAVIRSLSD